MSSSVRNLSLAAGAALAIHLLLLALRIVSSPLLSNEEIPITVNLKLDEVKEPPIDEPESEPPEAEQTPEPIVEQTIEPIAEAVSVPEPRAEKPEVNAQDLIIATKPSADVQEKILIQTSPQSTQFKRFLDSETERFIQQNPDLIGAFDQSFEPPPVEESPIELASGNTQSISRGRNAYATESNGRRTCGVKTLNLLDIHASPTYVGADCTPEKKFVLELNKPNNGWTER